MSASLEQAKALLLKEHALDFQKRNGGTFQRAWEISQRDHPELSEVHADQEQEAATAGSAPYRFIDRPARPRHETIAELSRRLIDGMPEAQAVRIEA